MQNVGSQPQIREKTYFPMAYFFAAAVFEFALLIVYNGLSAIRTSTFWFKFLEFYPLVILGAWSPGIRHIVASHYRRPKLAEAMHDPFAVAFFSLFFIGISPTQAAASVALLFSIGALSHFLLAHPMEKKIRSIGAAIAVPTITAGIRGALPLLAIV